MKTIYYAFAALVILNFLPSGNLIAQCANPGDIYMFNVGNQNYGIVMVNLSWEESSLCAQELNGVLTHIESQEEQDAIYNAIIASGISPTYHPVPDGGGTSYIWIGATDKNSEGTWIWDGDNNGNGTNFWNGQGAAGSGNGSATGNSFVNWGGKSAGVIMEPDNWSDQDAAAIALTGWPFGSTTLGVAGEWNDIGIENSLYFILELNPVGLDNPVQSELKYHLSPNPAKNIIEITNVTSKDNISFFTIDGIALSVKPEARSDNKVNYDISAWAPGLYIIEVVNEVGVTTLKLIKDQ